MSDLRELLALAGLLRGEAAEVADWPGVVNLANRTLLTPTLARASGLGQAPDDIRAFVAAAGHLNDERNRRLLSQLADAAAALNAAALEATVLKGAALLLTQPTASAGRMLSDLDLLVDGGAVEAAIAALGQAGFAVVARYQHDDGHVAAELHRPGDVGMIDLHRRAPGPRDVLTAPPLAGRSSLAYVGGAQVRVPSPEAQILHLALHDLFHEGDYWSGALDLRHLQDVAILAGAEPDWTLFSRRLLGSLGLRAVRRYFFTAGALFGAAIPPSLRAGPGARLQHWRAMAQLRAPALRPWLVGVGLLAEAPAALAHYGRERRWRRASALTPSTPGQRLQGRMARLARSFEPPTACKV